MILDAAEREAVVVHAHHVDVLGNVLARGPGHVRDVNADEHAGHVCDGHVEDRGDEVGVLEGLVEHHISLDGAGDIGVELQNEQDRHDQEADNRHARARETADVQVLRDLLVHVDLVQKRPHHDEEGAQEEKKKNKNKKQKKKQQQPHKSNNTALESIPRSVLGKTRKKKEKKKKKKNTAGVRSHKQTSQKPLLSNTRRTECEMTSRVESASVTKQHKSTRKAHEAPTQSRKKKKKTRERESERESVQSNPSPHSTRAYTSRNFNFTNETPESNRVPRERVRVREFQERVSRERERARSREVVALSLLVRKVGVAREPKRASSSGRESEERVSRESRESQVSLERVSS